MQRRSFLLSTSISAVLTSMGLTALPGAARAAAQGELPAWAMRLEHLADPGDTKAAEVFFTTDVSPEALIRVYEAVGRKAAGKVAVKISFESAGGPHLEPAFLGPFCDHVKGTLVDTHCFTSRRGENAEHMELIREKGFDKVAPVDILDWDGDMDLPVKNGYYLKYTRTGSHFANYDDVISVVRFKGHYLPRYGGTMKNLSIALGSLSGKAIIHSLGENERYYQRSSDQETSMAMADAVRAALDAKPGRWVFINVVNSFEPNERTNHGAVNLGDIGIFASTDPVALDQVCCDLVYGAAPSLEVRRQWEDSHSTDVLAFAEAKGTGTRRARLTRIA
ncbi:DUF362 domain-containing protein [Sutterella sp.]|uniref:DUF362 domain-containing protein n=1 Tax=Sutterella sp. TaxID=1981025 RepID=UPI0026E057F9|nr:DUF362 domain-containing protein [Sutterella sp.]MDO5532160.1 DUF362 domain-containing protein [Sutterella sp.]